MNNNQTLFTFAVILLFVAAGCRSKKEEKTEVLRPVRYIVAGTSDNKHVRTFSGFARVGKDVTLSFRANGVLVETNVSKGQFVKKGKLLGRLDNVEAQLAYEKAISELNRAESELSTSETNFNRIKYLYEQGAKPLIEYENAKNTFKSAASLYETAQRNRDIQKTQMEYGFIYAPSDGIVLETDGDVNERISAGHNYVVLNISDGRMKVIVNLPESVINKISLKMPVEIMFSAIPGKSFQGEIYEISPDVTEESATYPVNIEIINPTGEIKPGMAANVTFEFSKENTGFADNLILPISTVSKDAGGNFVFLVKADGKKAGIVVKKQVEIGQLTAEGFEIIAGISAGDTVVSAGLQSLLDGQKVGLQ